MRKEAVITILIVIVIWTGIIASLAIGTTNRPEKGLELNKY
jgi:hypothetical protein